MTLSTFFEMEINAQKFPSIADKHISIDNVDLAYKDAGIGQILLCLHAIGHSSKDFAALYQLDLHHYRIISLDFPGHGNSQAARRPVSASYFSKIVLEFIEKLELKDLIIVGNSIGGATAIRVASNNPNINMLALSNPGGLDKRGFIAPIFLNFMVNFFRKGEEMNPKFKNNKTTVLAVKIGRQDLAPLVSVSEQEIKDYLSKPENKKAIEIAYTENFSKYNKPEEVKARHILIKGADEKSLQKIKEIRSKVNVGNFSQVANKETQDTSGQSNGGDLGWFAKGRMVPEFEKVAFEMKLGEISEPVKTEFGYHLILVEDKKAQETKPMDAVKSELALMEIQKTKAPDLDKLLNSTREQIKQALRQNDVAQVEGLTKKVEGQIFKDTEINQYDQNLGSVSLTHEESEKVFGSNPGDDILSFREAGTIFLVKILSKKSGPEQTPDQIKSEVSSQREQLSRKVREEFIKDLNGKAKIVTNQSLL